MRNKFRIGSVVKYGFRNSHDSYCVAYCRVEECNNELKELKVSCDKWIGLATLKFDEVERY